MPFMFDELSALNRTNFSNWDELIEKGVKVDGHPAGIQVFLYNWKNIAQDSEYLMRLPFLICALLSICFTYLLGKKHFSESTGLAACAAISCLQFTIFYSQLARPYASGLFFTVAFAYYFLNWIDTISQKVNNKILNFKDANFLLWILFGTLSAYNHYFSFLTCIFIGISGFILLQPKDYLKLVLGGIGILILYLPHLNIFISQLSMSGLDWLGKPSLFFLFDFFNYLFHFSFPLILIVLFFAIFPIFLNWPFDSLAKQELRQSKIQNSKLKKSILMLFWFLLPYLTGHFYSVYKSPVLQYSLLIFGIPFFFIFLFSLWNDKIKPIFLFSFLSIFIIISTYTLIFNRKHQDLMLHQQFSDFTIHTQNILKNDPKTPIFWNSSPNYLAYYLKKYNANFQYDTLRGNSSELWKSKIDSKSNSNQIILGNPEPDQLAYALTKFPNIKQYEKSFTYDFYLLDKQSEIKNPSQKPIFEQVKKDSLKILPENEFVELYNSSEKIFKSRYNLFNSQIDFKLKDNSKECLIVCVFEKNEIIKYNKQIKLNDFIKNVNSWNTVSFGIRMTEIEYWNEFKNMKIFIWNVGKNEIEIENFKMQIWAGNEKIYGLYEEF